MKLGRRRNYHKGRAAIRPYARLREPSFNLHLQALLCIPRVQVLARLLGVTAPAGSMTGGLVQDIEHAVLPAISPATTLALTSLLWLPALAKLWSCPNNTLQFIR